MAKTDSSSMNVDFGRIQIQFLNISKNDDTEGFVDFPQRYVVNREIISLQQLKTDFLM